MNIIKLRERMTKPSHLSVKNGKNILIEFIICIFSSAGHNPKQIFRWEDQEIYYFSMALKEFGKNYEYISKIIETKQVIFEISFSRNYFYLLF